MVDLEKRVNETASKSVHKGENGDRKRKEK